MATVANGGVASAATSTDLLYSVDGGATWSSDITAAPGQTVLVRQWFDNTDPQNHAGSSVTTDIPAGFTRVSGSTQLCLNPSTVDPQNPDPAEQKCAASDESSVWSGPSLTISPSAGFYGESNGQRVGQLAMGRPRYLNMSECLNRRTVPGDWDDTYATLIAPSSGTALGDSPTGASCTSYQGGQVFSQVGQSFDLLGNRYLNLRECQSRRVDPGNWDDVDNTALSPYTGSNAGNGPTASDCPATGPTGGNTASSRLQSLDLNSGRYLNLHQCTYRRLDPGNWDDLYLSIVAPYTGTNVGNTANTSGSCAAGPHGGSLLEGRVQSLDLFDPTRARGFVEYQIVAPPTPTPEQCEAGETESSVFEQDGTLLTASGNQTDSGTITVDWTVLGDPCVEIPLVDPVVGAPAAAAVAIGGYVLHRRRRSSAVA